MLSYANLHFALERLRQHADDTQGDGPRVLILGSVDSGKSSLAKILVSYAVRQGRAPILVGLDPKQVGVSIITILTR
jgi:polyribonucleotide 5'-hydroxyl-kinase